MSYHTGRHRHRRHRTARRPVSKRPGDYPRRRTTGKAFDPRRRSVTNRVGLLDYAAAGRPLQDRRPVEWLASTISSARLQPNDRIIDRPCPDGTIAPGPAMQRAHPRRVTDIVPIYTRRESFLRFIDEQGEVRRSPERELLTGPDGASAHHCRCVGCLPFELMSRRAASIRRPSRAFMSSPLLSRPALASAALAGLIQTD